MWTCVALTLEDYIAFWSSHKQRIRQYARAEMASLLNFLLTEKMANREDEIQFQNIFLSSNRRSVNLCPGVELIKRFDCEDIESTIAGIKSSIVEAFQAWNQIFI